jgi:hypothetical protein
MPGVDELPDPDALWNDIWTNQSYSAQERYDKMIAFEQDQYNADNPDPEDTTTPAAFRNGSKWAPLTENPTSTSNVNEPRTLGAGYDSKNFILTVQFRDGTLYNYYDVPPSIWREFRAAPSKGVYMQADLDSWPTKGKVAGHSEKYYKRVASAARKNQKNKYGSIDDILGRHK